MESELLRARIKDTYELCRKNEKPKFLGFLSSEEAVLAQNIISKTGAKFDFFGGYPDAKRTFLGCFPDWCEEYFYPIEAITFSFRKEDKLSHRDFLGSLMALGLKRESVGDILIEEGRAVVFLSEDIADFVLSSIEKIGRIGVKGRLGIDSELPKADELQELSVTVSSLRLDCVISAVCSLSRNTANEKLRLSLVQVNSEISTKATRQLNAGDIISVRGFGKFKISDATDLTRKNRIILKYKKYC